VSRAFAALDEFVAGSRHLVRAGGWWAAMKGAWPAAELAALADRCPDVREVEVVKLAVPRLDAERHLVLLQRP
jgi:16S rRNA (guanine527-N7)-methyltransferase